MPLSHIEHYLVLSDEIDATRDWYRDVLGMQEGWHPDFGAFRAKGLKQTLSHLRRHKVEFSERRANGQALYQLFMYDPNGIKVELNFDAAEAQGIEPEITAEKLAARENR